LKERFWRIYDSESQFSLQPVRMPTSESRSPMKVRTVQRMRATKSIRLQDGPDADAMIADSGSILCNCLDARVTGSDALQRFLEVLVVLRP
jgi:hypothetical protein